MDDLSLISGSSDKKLKEWRHNGSAYYLFNTYTGHSSAVFALTYLAPNYIVSGDYGGKVNLWNVSQRFDNGTFAPTDVTSFIDSSAIFSMSYSTTNQFIVSGLNSIAQVYYVEANATYSELKLRKNLVDHTSYVPRSTFNSDLGCYVTGDWSGRVNIYNESLELMQSLIYSNSSEVSVESVIMLGNGNVAISLVSDGVVRIWDYEIVQEVTTTKTAATATQGATISSATNVATTVTTQSGITLLMVACLNMMSLLVNMLV